MKSPTTGTDWRLLLALVLVAGALGVAVLLAAFEQPAPVPRVLSLREIDDTIADVSRYVREAGNGLHGG